MAVIFLHFFNPFVVDALILYPLKTLDNQRFFGISKWNKRDIGQKWMKSLMIYCKKYRNFTLFSGVDILWKSTVSVTWGKSPEAMRRLCLSKKISTPGN